MNKITLDEVTSIKPISDEKKQENMYERKPKKEEKKKLEKSKHENKRKKGDNHIDIYA